MPQREAMRQKADGATAQAAVAVDLARQRYHAGEDALTILLNAQSAYSVAERASLDARVGELMAVVALYKALGVWVGGRHRMIGLPLLRSQVYRVSAIRREGCRRTTERG